MIVFEKVSFTYAANPREKSLSDITLTIKKGECVLLTGPSGCSKSTLLRLLNGLIPEFYVGKREGSIRIGGQEAGEHIYEFAGRIGTVFQNPRSQFFNVDTTSELAFGCENLGVPEEEILDRMDQTVSRMHMEPLMDRSIFHLSGGEKQKIACGSVDVLAPDIILLDEPSANLDFESTEGLREIIREWKSRGKTILIAEHRIHYVWELADKAVILQEGKIRCVLEGRGKEQFTEDMCSSFGLRSMRRVSPAEMSLADRHPMSLSGGQKQRLAMACGVASESEILLLDEPTSGLDRQNMEAAARILNRLKETGKTIITVTHDSEFIACVCDGVIQMEGKN